MARTHSQYPRSTLRTLLRSHASSSSPHTLSPNSDSIAFVAHLAFLRRLAREVRELVEEEKGGKGKKRVEAADLRRASKELPEGAVQNCVDAINRRPLDSVSPPRRPEALSTTNKPL
ncbi:Sterol 3-beta-glucosyltransferase [Rhodotorula toruloides]|nr:Sterol 3-beta-glucosyltransferase [Rhodotorula toruloides]